MKRKLFFTLTLIVVLALFVSNVFADDTQITSSAFDNIFRTDVGGTEEKLNLERAYEYLEDNPQSYMAGEVETIALRGWAGDTAEIKTFGYKINYGDFVTGDFKEYTEAGVISAGGEFASRFTVIIPIKDLGPGEYEATVHAELTDGRILQACIMPFTIEGEANAETNSNMLATVTLALAVAGMAFVLFKKESFV